jgi:uncharacterized protein
MGDMLHRPGSFCTSMLYTRDLDRSRAFYQQWMPAWQFAPAQGDPQHVTIACDGRSVAHAHVSPGDDDQWVPMVAVVDRDATLQYALTVGATLVDTDEIDGVARVARLRDLEGAEFGLWQPAPDGGAAVSDEVGSLWWLEVLSTDAESSQQFYGRLFGWQARDTSFEPFDCYIVLERDGQQEGGILPIPAEWDVAPRWNTIVAVQDADRACRNAEALGGCTLFAHDVPRAGRIAGISDPGGALLVVRGPLAGPPFTDSRPGYDR